MYLIEKEEPIVQLDKSTKQLLQCNVEKESQVIIHCAFSADTNEDQLVRIWRSTYLCAKGSSHKSNLAYIENISIAPKWSLVNAGSTLHFTLIFSGLPKYCQSFDFKEEIPEPGGFVVKNIARNSDDVYRLSLN